MTLRFLRICCCIAFVSGLSVAWSGLFRDELVPQAGSAIFGLMICIGSVMLFIASREGR